MATILDVSLLQSVDVIFPFIFVWALIFALLQKTKFLGVSPAINGLLAAVVGFTVLLFRTVVDIINFMIPWFTVAIIFFVLLILVFQTFGLKDADLATAAKDKAVYWTLIGIAIIIAGAAFSSVFGQMMLEQSAGATDGGETTLEEGGVATGSFEKNIFSTLFHPKVLGLIVLFGIAIFAVALLTYG